MSKVVYSSHNNYTIPSNSDIYLFSIFITKDKIESIIQQFLLETWKIEVIGYNNLQDFYWVKLKNKINIFFVIKTINCYIYQPSTFNKVIKDFVDIMIKKLYVQETNISI